MHIVKVKEIYACKGRLINDINALILYLSDIFLNIYLPVFLRLILFKLIGVLFEYSIKFH